jgi:hypothetical protein
MKKFFFSLILVSLWIGALYFVGQRPESVPEAIRVPLEKCSASVQDQMGALEGYCASKGFECEPWTAQKKLAMMGGISFLGLWFSLSVILGIRGFFRDFFSFFPLRK